MEQATTDQLHFLLTDERYHAILSFVEVRGGNMSTESIVVEIDADLAQAYREVPEGDQSKLNLLLNLWLREVLGRSTSLTTLMDDLSDKAERHRLTAGKLADMLDAC
jgi:hypothetical protein